VELDHLKRLFSLLTDEGRRRLKWLLAFLPAVALSQLLVLAAVGPFTLVVVKPELILSSPTLSGIYRRLGMETVSQFMVWSGLTLLVCLVLSNYASFLVRWALIKLSADEHAALSSRLYKECLDQPYEWFIEKNTSWLLSRVRTNPLRVMIMGLRHLVDLMSNLVVLGIVFLVLVLIHPQGALSATAVLGLSYGLLYKLSRTRLHEFGAIMVEANERQTKIVQESFESFKDVKAFGAQRHFLTLFQETSRSYSEAERSVRHYVDAGRSTMEVVAFGGVVIAYLVMASAGQEPDPSLVALLAVYVVAAIRMMPLLQRSLMDVNEVRATLPFTKGLQELLEDLEGEVLLSEPMEELKEHIRVEGVEYRFSSTEEPILKGVSFTIDRNSMVGLVGPSGAGKTTLVDVLLGLLPPSDGRVLVDDQVLTPERAESWRKQLGYITQRIALLDDTVLRNIAFGLCDGEKIDTEAAVKAAQKAGLKDFVEQELPDGFETRIGDRGVRLSGGQRQRLSIARALYADPPVLILDEATSALDVATEKDVVAQLRHQKTLIVIAHRASIVQQCDAIIVLEEGLVSASGTYQELVEKSELFRSLLEPT
jgi:ABC-type multidrug transport system fused ATPase/permease subunit